MQQWSFIYTGEASMPGVDGGDSQLTVNVQRAGWMMTIRVSGELDIAVRDLVSAATETALIDSTDLRSLSLDVSDVTFIVCSGLRSLKLACEMVRERGLEFVLVRARSGPVAELLGLTRLTEWFEVGSHAG